MNITYIAERKGDSARETMRPRREGLGYAGSPLCGSLWVSLCIILSLSTFNMHAWLPSLLALPPKKPSPLSVLDMTPLPLATSCCAATFSQSQCSSCPQLQTLPWEAADSWWNLNYRQNMLCFCSTHIQNSKFFIVDWPDIQKCYISNFLSFPWNCILVCIQWRHAEFTKKFTILKFKAWKRPAGHFEDWPNLRDDNWNSSFDLHAFDR